MRGADDGIADIGRLDITSVFGQPLTMSKAQRLATGKLGCDQCVGQSWSIGLIASDMLIVAAEVDDSNENEAVRFKLLDSHGTASGRDVRSRQPDEGADRAGLSTCA